VSQVKLIAEPWDVGKGGYQIGNFPPPWTEWNGKYRDTIRDFWRGQGGVLPGFASRLTGSPDLYLSTGRRPYASINFVTCHDGFTLLDLVSYDRKHNQANGEDDRDGWDDNRSWNCGFEGPTADPNVTALRKRQQRNFLATLLVSQGVPMLLAGDELGRTQQGNNNPYCQANEVSWVNWDKKAQDDKLLEFVQEITRLRSEHAVFRRRRFFSDAPSQGGMYDIAWFTPSGQQVTEDNLNTVNGNAVAVFLNGDAITEPDAHGQPLVDDSFLLLFNPAAVDVIFEPPPSPYDGQWKIELDTAISPRRVPAEMAWPALIGSHSLRVLRRPARGLSMGSQ
jgi:glycogen operon protein